MMSLFIMSLFIRNSMSRNSISKGWPTTEKGLEMEGELTSREVEEALGRLESETRTEVVETFKRCFNQQTPIVRAIDCFIPPVLHRILGVTRGFCQLVRTRNFLCAGVLVRVHLDTLLRFAPIYFVNDANALLREVLKGTHMRRIKDRWGECMTDTRLWQLLARENPWVKHVYEQASGFVHFSNTHFHLVIDRERHDIAGGRFATVVSGEDVSITDELRMEATDAMKAITGLILRFVEGWARTKGGDSELEAAMAKAQNLTREHLLTLRQVIEPGEDGIEVDTGHLAELVGCGLLKKSGERYEATPAGSGLYYFVLGKWRDV